LPFGGLGKAIVVITERGAAEPGKAVDQFAPIVGFNIYPVAFGHHYSGSLLLVLAQIGLAVDVVVAILRHQRIECCHNCTSKRNRI
jgi:hypothetical protein